MLKYTIPSQDNAIPLKVYSHQLTEEKKGNNVNTDSIYSRIGQLMVTLTSDQNKEVSRNILGTATYIGSCAETGRHFILTCAHNFMYVCDDEDKTVMKAMRAVFFLGRQSLDDNSNVCKVTDWIVYPDYKKQMNTYGGADIALAIIDLPSHIKFPIGKFGISADWFDIQDKDVPLSIYGYPGEKELVGGLYGMEGCSNSLRMVKSTNRTDLIQYSDIDTSGGQSGSPILLRLQLENGHEGYYIGAVHVAEDMANKVNFGTLLTKDKFQWMIQKRKISTESEIGKVKSIKEVK